MKLILPIAYAAPTWYYHLLLHANDVLFEVEEHFVKQTIRNRCSIYGANGPLNLIVPVKHTATKIRIKDLEISWDEPWSKMHWKSIESAYRKSAYFIYYEDAFRKIYAQKQRYLIDFNFEVQTLILKCLKEDVKIQKTTLFEKEYVERWDGRSFSDTLLKESKAISYPQVFGDKHGFIPHLSILDCLFNLGPETKGYLAKISSIKPNFV